MFYEGCMFAGRSAQVGFDIVRELWDSCAFTMGQRHIILAKPTDSFNDHFNDQTLGHIIAEVSMAAAANYHLLDFRTIYAHAKNHAVAESNYRRPGCSFWRCPIVIPLGAFRQISPTAALSVVDVGEPQHEDGQDVRSSMALVGGLESQCRGRLHVHTLIVRDSLAIA